MEIDSPFGRGELSVTFWASTGCPAKLEAFDENDRLVDTAAVEAARKSPADPAWSKNSNATHTAEQ